MPSRQQIDPVEIPRLLPIVLIAERVAVDARIRLLGSEATNVYGREIRGKLVTEIAFGEFTPLWLKAFMRVIAIGLPTAAAGPFHRPDRHHNIEVVLLPLSDDGVSVSHIIGGLSMAPAQLSVSNGSRSSSSNLLPARAGQILELDHLRL